MPCLTTGAYHHMARDIWRTSEGKAEATAESAKGVAAFQRQRDERKAEAIALDASGLDAKRDSEGAGSVEAYSQAVS